jgi:hypothetical protein
MRCATGVVMGVRVQVWSYPRFLWIKYHMADSNPTALHIRDD